ncbi:serine/threonine-protein kinase [Cryptosporangium arvum]|uniref:serine/threonine-protein kinase n=1 Tax=Cryptosporangium arvum TaxID=80871 RepID=UPI0004AD54E3|nr:serine/threonine-protein kinase [Cryptosporangium arvum]
MLFDRAKIVAALPSYEVGREVGSGGFGTVLEGRHRSLGRPVAIKVLAMPDAGLERRFLSEAQVMAAFDHPHVVHVHDYADDAGLCLLVMEHCPGGTLTTRLRAGLTPESACAIALSVADALHAAHLRGIVHRDVKPDNVLFAADGAAKVTDFGLAKIFEGSVVTSGSLVGTPGYAAPEQILGQPVRPATDVYALGGVTYHMLTGRPPFPTDLPVREMLHQQIYGGPDLPGGLSDRFAAVLGQALTRDPAERTASAKDFALLLAAAAAAELGADWLTRAEPPLRVEEDVLRAMSDRAGAIRTPTAPAPRRRLRGGAGALHPDAPDARPGDRGAPSGGPPAGPAPAGRRPGDEPDRRPGDEPGRWPGDRTGRRPSDETGRRPAEPAPADRRFAEPSPGGAWPAAGPDDAWSRGAGGSWSGSAPGGSRGSADRAGDGRERAGRHAAPDAPPPFPSGPSEELTEEEVQRRIAAWERPDEGFSRRTWVILAAVIALLAAVSVGAGVVIGQLQRGG